MLLCLDRGVFDRPVPLIKLLQLLLQSDALLVSLLVVGPSGGDFLLRVERLMLLFRALRGYRYGQVGQVRAGNGPVILGSVFDDALESGQNYRVLLYGERTVLGGFLGIYNVSEEKCQATSL